MSNRDIHWTPEAPAILHKAGVKVALQSDGPRVFPAHYLTFIAAAAAKALAATRQLAKRQITWLRSEQELRSFDPLEAHTIDAISTSLIEFFNA